MDLAGRIRSLRAENARRQIPRGAAVYLSGYSDASVKARDVAATRIDAGVGVWVRDDTHRVLLATPVPPRHLAGPLGAAVNAAELFGVTVAVGAAVRHLCVLGANIAVIKTDNQTVAGWFGWKDPKGGPNARARFPRNPASLEALAHAFGCAKRADVKLVVTWRGGLGRAKKEAERYLNDRVDALAHDARLGKKFWTRHRVGGERSAPVSPLQVEMVREWIADVRGTPGYVEGGVAARPFVEDLSRWVEAGTPVTTTEYDKMKAVHRGTRGLRVLGPPGPVAVELEAAHRRAVMMETVGRIADPWPVEEK